MKRAISKIVSHNAGGYFVEFYVDDDGASGYGDHAKVARWYGSREECAALARSETALPRGLRWAASVWEADCNYSSGCAYAAGERDDFDDNSEELSLIG